MEQRCDNKSVGVIIENSQNEILLMNRAKFPYGWAAPAGHVDDHGSLEQAAIDEVFEEVGLVVAADSLLKVIDARRIENQCRRAGGDHHVWTVFAVSEANGTVQPSDDEVRNYKWFNPAELQALAQATQSISEVTEADRDVVLEGVWFDFFTELGKISLD